MRTNIEIDDQLMADALKVSGAKTKREAVDIALQFFVRIKRQVGIRDLKGKINWQGDLDAMRRD
jgi:Arc/MetJ family transcription regulator